MGFGWRWDRNEDGDGDGDRGGGGEIVVMTLSCVFLFPFLCLLKRVYGFMGFHLSSSLANCLGIVNVIWPGFLYLDFFTLPPVLEDRFGGEGIGWE